MYFFVSSEESAEPKLPKEIDKSFNSFCNSKCLKEAVDGRLQCKCGEVTSMFEWTWQDQRHANVKVSNGCREVLFHPVYSSGTAGVKGPLPFRQNCHYYWEIKMISKLYGTDVMIGVGTSKVVFEDWSIKFGSLLGIDPESWGYSYHGNIQHNNLRRKYGLPFGLGSIVGVHLDLCNGTLEYFLNRKSLGIAFRELKGKELYPMVCSTAAQSSMRIICCISSEPSLQMMCLRHIVNHPGLYSEYEKIPGLSKIYDRRFFWLQPHAPKDIEEKKRMAELEEDVALSLVDQSYLVKNKKPRTFRLSLDVYDFSDLDFAQGGQHVDEIGEHSTSRERSCSPVAAERSKASPKYFHQMPINVYECLECLDRTTSRILGDSDTELDARGLSQIL